MWITESLILNWPAEHWVHRGTLYPQVCPLYLNWLTDRQTDWLTKLSWLSQTLEPGLPPLREELSGLELSQTGHPKMYRSMERYRTGTGVHTLCGQTPKRKWIFVNFSKDIYIILKLSWITIYIYFIYCNRKVIQIFFLMENWICINAEDQYFKQTDLATLSVKTTFNMPMPMTSNTILNTTVMLAWHVTL